MGHGSGSGEEGKAQIPAWTGGCPFLHQQFKPIILTKMLLVRERDDKEEISHWERRSLWGGWPGLFWFCFQYTGSSKNTHDSGPLVAAENFGER